MCKKKRWGHAFQQRLPFASLFQDLACPRDVMADRNSSILSSSSGAPSLVLFLAAAPAVGGGDTGTACLFLELPSEYLLQGRAISASPFCRGATHVGQTHESSRPGQAQRLAHRLRDVNRDAARIDVRAVVKFHGVRGVLLFAKAHEAEHAGFPISVSSFHR